MVLEVAVLDVLPGRGPSFRRDFNKAQQIICAMSGYIDHQLQRCIEKPDRYILLVNWESIEDHTIGFRQSAEYREWKKILHHHYDPFPVVEHYEAVFSSAAMTPPQS